MSGVTRVAKDLAGIPEGRSDWKERNIDMWIDRPILRGNNEEWKTTAYGSVLAYHLQLSEGTALLHPLYDIPEEVIDSAIEELDL